MFLYKEVKVNLEAERKRVRKGTGAKDGFNNRESAFLLKICDLMEAGDFVGIAEHLDKHPREWREWIGVDVFDVIRDMGLFGYRYGVFPGGMSGHDFVKKDGKLRLPNFNGTLVLSKRRDYANPKGVGIDWYGFKIILFVSGFKHPPSAGEVVWEAEFTSEKEAMDLGKSIAHDLHVTINKVVRPRGRSHEPDQA